ncbi:MAG: ATP-dependent protease ATPase subunit HslU [Fimbriimonadaceae bacterium]
MTRPPRDLTPREIVAQLDRYIVGQDEAKRAVAVALRNRFRRMNVSDQDRADIVPKNILMLGPTGVGKTAIARRLASLVRAPFIKVEATKFTEVGYVGRDVESMVRDLAAEAVRLVQAERLETVLPAATEAAHSKIAERLDPDLSHHFAPWATSETDVPAPDPEVIEQRRRTLMDEIAQGKHDDEEVEVDVEEVQNPMLQVFTNQGIEELGMDSGGPFSQTRLRTRAMTVYEARTVLVEAETKKRLDTGTIHREALQRAQESGIIFIDEIDKVAMPSKGAGPDVSREGVQRDLLPVIEGCTVPTKFGPLSTEHVLYIAAGAFHVSKPDDLIPELQGRLPIRVTLGALTTDDLERILLEPENAILKQYRLLLGSDGVQLEFDPSAVKELAKMATIANEQGQNIGARRLATMIELLLGPELFGAPDSVQGTVRVDDRMVQERLGPIMDDPETRRRML